MQNKLLLSLFNIITAFLMTMRLLKHKHSIRETTYVMFSNTQYNLFCKMIFFYFSFYKWCKKTSYLCRVSSSSYFKYHFIYPLMESNEIFFNIKVYFYLKRFHKNLKSRKFLAREIYFVIRYRKCS